ncbi:MAG: HAMP domain-containing histidine kinase [Rhodothermales bacterium]|nr:HAMP domain-containing histidine kinase [Rhodothermales bacterium]MBO6778178.1 HAMP domain-containing histidine kinase [Rhodothermales bacterium]
MAALLLPLALLLGAVRVEVRGQLTDEYRDRVRSLVETAESRLEGERRLLLAAAESAAQDLATQPGLVRFLRGDSAWLSAVPGLLDRTAARTGMNRLQVRLDEGRVLGDEVLPHPEAGTDPQFFVTEEGTWLVVATPAELADRGTALIGARKVGSDFWRSLAPDSMLVAGLISQNLLRAGESRSGLSAEMAVRVSDGERWRDGVVRITHSLGPLDQVLGALDRWLLLALLVVAVSAVGISWWASHRFTRPIRELRETYSRTNLDSTTSAPRFLAQRRDEIGGLSRSLEGMLRRFRGQASRLRQTERRAALGDFARQANHDIKNGLTPVRNVMRHLDEVSNDPAELGRVFADRRSTLESGMDYLQSLATAYARLAASPRLESVNLSAEVRGIVAALADDRVHCAASGEIRANVDRLALRRVLENLIANGLDSLPEGGGSVQVRAASDHGKAVLEVRDTGSGMPEEVRARVFEDFFTTKSTGAGLGLSIVRRLVSDMDGSIDVDSTPGEGTCFVIQLPLASAHRD